MTTTTKPRSAAHVAPGSIASPQTTQTTGTVAATLQEAPSVIVDRSANEPLGGGPFTLAEVEALSLPSRVVAGMWVASLARADRRPLLVRQRRFEIATDTPDDLWECAIGLIGSVNGAIGVGVPVLFDRPDALGWTTDDGAWAATSGRTGKGGAS